MNKKRRILVVDDEPGVRKSVTGFFRTLGHETVEASDGNEALSMVEEANPDLLNLDITMPGLDGFQVCQRVREWSSVPIIMLSAVMDQSSKVRTLQLGADDYMVKPFDLEELQARVEAVLRRTSHTSTPSDPATVVSGELSINFAAHIVTVGGSELSLTATEFNLLRELALNRGKVMTHTMLLHNVWGPEYRDEVEYVRVFVNRLRSKIGDDPQAPRYIKTDSGVGYHFLS